MGVRGSGGQGVGDVSLSQPGRQGHLTGETAGRPERLTDDRPLQGQCVLVSRHSRIPIMWFNMLWLAGLPVFLLLSTGR